MPRWLIMLAWVGWISSGLPSVAKAEEAKPSRELYLRYCGSCHGASGKGDGPVAPSLASKPSDLTQLAKRNGGKFDGFLVYQQTSGRPPTVHGTRDMPVWGEVLLMEPGGGGDPGGADPRAAELKLVKIVEYLRSIQTK